jgi:glycosyltransferase involved in cell wall biosynthesis
LIVGGAQENTLYTVVGLRKLPRYEVVDLVTGPTTGPEGSIEKTAVEQGVDLIRVPELIRAIRPLTDFAALRKLKHIVRQGRYDIVHTHSAKGGVLGRMAAKSAGVPVIVHTIHGPSFFPYQSRWKNFFYKSAERYVGRMTTHFISVADAMTKQYLAAGIGRPGQYTTIYSGMEIGAFLNQPRDETLREQLGIKPDELVVGKIARLFELKGHNFLLAAAPQIARQVPQVKFLLVGDGLLHQHYQKEAQRLGIADRVLFTGLVPPQEMPRYISVMDVVAHLSLREGLPRTLPQALACGKPVVAFDLDGSAEVCLDGRTGFLIPAEDVGALTRTVVRLLRDRELAGRMGAAGREWVREKFSIETMVRQIDELYQRLWEQTKTKQAAASTSIVG